MHCLGVPFDEKIAAVILKGHIVFFGMTFQMNLFLSRNWDWFAADCLPSPWFLRTGIHPLSSSFVSSLRLSTWFTIWLCQVIKNILESLESSVKRESCKPAMGAFVTPWEACFQPWETRFPLRNSAFGMGLFGSAVARKRNQPDDTTRALREC